jgi:hypothetical protein
LGRASIAPRPLASAPRTRLSPTRPEPTLTARHSHWSRLRLLVCPRIVVLSDIHLSPTHGFFWENWRLARELADAAKSDAVIVNGDLAINGPVRANPQNDEGRRGGGLRIEARIGDDQNAAIGCLRDRRNPTKPRPAKPASIIAQVAGSGTAGGRAPS